MVERRAAIAGTGLIGSSIGLGLIEEGWQVVGWDPDRAAMSGAREVGALSAVSPSIAGLLDSGPDLLVLAGPIEAVVRLLSELATDVLTIFAA